MQCLCAMSICNNGRSNHCNDMIVIHQWLEATTTLWRRLIGCLKMQVVFRKRATNYRALVRKILYQDKASYGGSPPCICNVYMQRLYAMTVQATASMTVTHWWGNSNDWTHMKTRTRTLYTHAHTHTYTRTEYTGEKKQWLNRQVPGEL